MDRARVRAFESVISGDDTATVEATGIFECGRKLSLLSEFFFVLLSEIVDGCVEKK